MIVVAGCSKHTQVFFWKIPVACKSERQSKLRHLCENGVHYQRVCYNLQVRLFVEIVATTVMPGGEKALFAETATANQEALADVVNGLQVCFFKLQ